MAGATENPETEAGAERVMVYMTPEQRKAWEKAGREQGFKRFSPYVVFALTQFHRNKNKPTKASV